MAKLTEEENKVIIHSISEAFSRGDDNTAWELAKKIPLNPRLAQVAKDFFGKEELKKCGFDLSEAEVQYGSHWLDE